MEFSPERIRSIRHTLQMQTVETVFNEFGRNILNLSEEKRAVKYRKMSENVFRFFRGSTFLFYFYASREPLPFHTPADTPTWIQGDMHFENFGAFQNESGDLVYDVNDFDEGYLGSYLYDLLRMSVSIVLVAEMCGFSPDEQKKGL